MNVVLGTAAMILGWLMALLVAIGALTTATGTTPHPFIAAVQGAAPRLIPVGVLIGTLLLVAGRELDVAMLPGGVVLAGVFAWTLLLFPAAPVEGRPSGEHVRVLSVNLLITNDDVERIARDIDAVGADVVVTLETEEHTRLRLAEALGHYRLVGTGDGARGRWASVWAHERIAGNVVGRADLDAAGETLPGVRYRLDPSRDDRDLTIVGVHLHSPSGNDDIDAWRTELAALADAVAEGDGRTILAGDFNAGRSHPGLHPLLAVMRDAGRTPWATGTPTWPVLGRGEGPYRLLPPILDLDHILTGPELATRGYRTVNIHGSDHLGIVADVTLRNR